MINRGANPFVRWDGMLQYEVFNLDYLSNLPSQKSVYFITRPIPDEFMKQNNFLGPWRYKTGVFDGKFVSVIASEESIGTVISGYWFGKRAAYEFVQIGTQKYQTEARDRLKTLNERLTIGSTIQRGSKIAPLFHYR